MRLKLDETELYAFWLLAIAAHEPPYRMAWVLEKSTGIAFVKSTNLQLKTKQGAESAFLEFEHFECNDEAGYRTFHLLSNRAINEKMLLPELNGFDYLLIVKGNLDKAYLTQLEDVIKQNNNVIYQQKIDVKTLKNRNHIVF